MSFAQKIYYNNKPLILTTSKDEYVAGHTIAGGYMVFTGAFTRNYRLALQHLDKMGSLGAIIEDESPKSLQNELHKLYRPVDAGGGVVMNENDGVLMIFRRGKWDLPKGKRDDGEKIEECALREVCEETGLSNLKLKNMICETYHLYDQNNEQLLKHTVWYKMKGSSADKLVPQKEENIIEARWVDNGELGPYVYKSYEAIREVLHQAGFKW